MSSFRAKQEPATTSTWPNTETPRSRARGEHQFFGHKKAAPEGGAALHVCSFCRLAYFISIVAAGKQNAKMSRTQMSTENTVTMTRLRFSAFNLRYSSARAASTLSCCVCFLYFCAMCFCLSTC